MAGTPVPTPLGRVERQAPGTNNSTWGEPHLGEALARLTEMAQGIAQVTVNGAYTLASANYVPDEARMPVVVATGSGGTLTINSEGHRYLVVNRCSGVLTVTTGAGRTAAVEAGNFMSVLCDGSNVDLIRDTNIATQVAAGLAAAKLYADNKMVSGATLPGSSVPGAFVWTNPTTGAAEWHVPVAADITGLPASLAANSNLALAFAVSL